MSEAEDRRVDPPTAAYRLGITAELLFQYTKASFERTTGLRSLRTVEIDGRTLFDTRELDEFDSIIAGAWPGSSEGRLTVPKAIVDHLRVESMGQCARLQNGICIHTAHLPPWAESRCHHHANLIRICSACHSEHDLQNSLPTGELLALKAALIERTRRNLAIRMQSVRPIGAVPRPTKRFVGREVELADLVEALRSGRSALVTGVGGVGKTELLVRALGVAGTGRRTFWMDVKTHGTSADVMAALRTSLGRDGVACPEEAVGTRLDAYQACVVFDGVEHATLGDFDDFQDTLTNLHAMTSGAQFVVTSQVQLHGFQPDAWIKLGRLDLEASRKLYEGDHVGARRRDDDPTALLAFCDGHALTIRLATALRDHYGGSTGAMGSINAKGAAAVYLPGRTRQMPTTSLELCLRTAYDALSHDARKLLCALSECPAGVLTHYLEGDWLELGDTLEALAELRRWHLLELVHVRDALTRTLVLGPIRAFASQTLRNEDQPSYEETIERLSHAFKMMVAVLELNYSNAESTAYVVTRYGEELPNFLRLLETARGFPEKTALGLTTVSITQAMMRYFFVRGLPEQGARVMLEAAELAVDIGHAKRASGLILQSCALADRARDPAIMAAGFALAAKLEAQISDEEVLADLALVRGLAARSGGDHRATETHSREAFERYRRLLRLAVTEQKAASENFEWHDDTVDELHNDLSNALGLLAFAQMSQERYAEAGQTYRHALQHERGASIGVNRGQTLHQIGNCESHLGNFVDAAKLYIEAATIFARVEMEGYLSNAVGELGYALLDIDGGYPLQGLEGETVVAALEDLAADIVRVFNPSTVIDHYRASGMIRKTFGCIITATLTGADAALKDRCMALWLESLEPLLQDVVDGRRPDDHSYPLVKMQTALSLGFYAAEMEVAFLEEPRLPRDPMSQLLKAVCDSDDWTRQVIRVVDWLAAMLTHRWKLEGGRSERLHEFVKNYDEGVVDWLDLRL